MRVLIAPDKFKGSLTAREVCAAIADGLHAINSSLTIVSVPLTDGGEGYCFGFAAHIAAYNRLSKGCTYYEGSLDSSSITTRLNYTRKDYHSGCGQLTFVQLEGVCR